MQFPYFMFPLLGDPMIIAIDAVLHVIISHGVAIGMTAMVVLAEYKALRTGDERYERFARAMIKPVAIIITGVGAVTGVGIWFITSGLVPGAIGSMLRVFFWPWFIEWIVFVLEVIVVLIYYFTWHRWTGPAKRRHVLLGVGYVGLACMSAFLITGILAFMITSDGWPANRGLFTAFFNPSFLPQLLWRLSIAGAMGIAFTLFYVAFRTSLEPDFRRKLLRSYGSLMVFPLAGMAISAWWWWTSIPASFKYHAQPDLLLWTVGSLQTTAWVICFVAAGLVILALLTALLRSVWGVRLMIVPAALSLIFFVAGFERAREFMRGPFIMPGYMYANGVLMTEHEMFQSQGMLPNAPWFHEMAPEPTLEQKGSFLFARNCGACHTIGGRNDIVDRLRGRSEDGIYVILGRTDQMVPWMPPFSASPPERRITAKFLHNLVTDRYQLDKPDRFPVEDAPEGS